MSIWEIFYLIKIKNSSLPKHKNIIILYLKWWTLKDFSQQYKIFQLLIPQMYLVLMEMQKLHISQMLLSYYGLTYFLCKQQKEVEEEELIKMIMFRKLLMTLKKKCQKNSMLFWLEIKLKKLNLKLLFYFKN